MPVVPRRSVQEQRGAPHHLRAQQPAAVQQRGLHRHSGDEGGLEIHPADLREGVQDARRTGGGRQQWSTVAEEHSPCSSLSQWSRKSFHARIVAKSYPVEPLHTKY